MGLEILSVHGPGLGWAAGWPARGEHCHEGLLRHSQEAARSCEVYLFTLLYEAHSIIYDVKHNSAFQLGAYFEGSAALFYCAQQKISGCVFVAFGTSRLGRV